MTSRRIFLKVGAASACVLVTAGALDRGVFAESASPHSWRKLRAVDVALVSALAPAVLRGALPTDASRPAAIAEVVEAFDRTLSGLSPAVQKEVADLLSLLTFSPTRRFVAGLRHDWRESSEEDINAFLIRWQNHSVALLQQGYQALARVIVACWYGNPRAWGATGYPGVPYAKELGLE